MSFVERIFPAIMLGASVLTACAGQPAPATEDELDVNAILTSSIGTFAASIFETQTAQAVLSTQTFTPAVQPTNTALVLVTPSASATTAFVFNPVVSTVSMSPSPTGTQFTPTPNPSTLAFGCNNLVLISDVTIPAGTVLKPRETFTKTWKVQNNGTCDWALQFRLVFMGGNQMEGDPSGLGKVIEPQKWTQISVQLVAPKQPGTYAGTWRLGTQTGNVFGSTLTVSIVVASPTNTPVPATNTSVPPTSTETQTPTVTPTDTPPTP